MIRPTVFITMLFVFVGCGTSVDPVRYTSSAAETGGRVSVGVQSVSLREVSLPAYAAEEGISVADGSGAITASAASIWADDPTRAVTLRLTNALADLTGRIVASDPWPFQNSPEAVVEVRVEDFVAEAAGQFVARGRYYVGYQEAEQADRAVSFRLVEPFDPAQGFAAIAEARSRVVTALARDIARRGLR